MYLHSMRRIVTDPLQSGQCGCLLDRRSRGRSAGTGPVVVIESIRQPITLHKLRRIVDLPSTLKFSPNRRIPCL